MMGTIVHFRGSRKRKRGNQMIIQVDKVTSRDTAKELVGKTVVWSAPGKNKKEIRGKVTSTHGSKGCIRVHFEKGMPGQSLGEKVKIE